MKLTEAEWREEKPREDDDNDKGTGMHWLLVLQPTELGTAREPSTEDRPFSCRHKRSDMLGPALSYGP